MNVRYTGEVYQLPPGDLPNDDPKYRPHVLLNDTTDDDVPCTFAYCSGERTEAMHGASAVLIDPSRSGYQGTGFVKPTYVYLSRLVTLDPNILGSAEGRVFDQLPLIRERLKGALGIGTGSGSGSGPAAGSKRGLIVVIKSAFADVLGTPYAMLVTEPGYSIQERYQIVMPVLNADEYDAEPGDVAAEGNAQELKTLGITFTNLLFSVSLAESLYHAEAIERSTSLYASDEILAKVDLQFILRFSI